jgi:hypothetical protein
VKKYTDSMPSATDYGNLRLKIALLFALPVVLVVWFLSIWGLLHSRSANDPGMTDIPVNRFSATVVGGSQAEDGGYLDVQFFTGKKRNRANVSVDRQDLKKFYRDQTVIIVRDDAQDARYEYCLFEDYVSNHRRAQITLQSGLWLGTTVPPILALWYWKRRSGRKAMAHDLYGKDIPA